MTSLYELNGWLLRLQYQLEEAQDSGSDLETIEGYQKAFDAVGDLTEEQIVNAAYAIKNYRACAESLKAEEKRLKKKREAYEMWEDKLKETMLKSLKILGKKKVNDNIVSVSQRATAANMVLDVPEEEIPDEWFKIEKSLKKRDLEAAIKNGDTTYGHMGEKGVCLVIK